MLSNGSAYMNPKMFYNTISSTNSASVGGDLQESRYHSGAGGPTYAFWIGGWNGSTRADTIEYQAYSSPGNNAGDWGNLTFGAQSYQTCDSDSRTITWGGYGNGTNGSLSLYYSAMNYWNNTSTGNASAFGNTAPVTCNSSYYGKYSGMAVSNGTRGEKWAGMGYTGWSGDGGCNYIGNLNIDYVTIASQGNAINFGDQTVAASFRGGFSNQIRCGAMGGETPSASDVIDYVTIASTGDAIDFGDTTNCKFGTKGVASRIRGVFMGGETSPGSYTNSMEYISIDKPSLLS